MFKKVLCGTDTGHKNGYVFRKAVATQYLLCCFTSPFFFEVKGKRIECEAGTCVINKIGDKVVHGPLDDKSQFVNHWLWFVGDGDEIEKLFLPFDVPIEIHDTDFFKNCIDFIMEQSLKNDEFSAECISNEIFKMLVSVKRAHQKSGIEKDETYEKFNKLRIYFFNHCSEKWTLKKMADLSGYSVSRFCNIYVSLFNNSPMDDLLEWRFEFAKHLLLLNTHKISEIAEMCGFSSVHYFSRFFTERTGISPKNYK